MMVKTSGEGVAASAPRRERWRPEEVARARDLAMLRMKREGTPVATIAAMFNVDRKTVARRIKAASEAAVARDEALDRG